MVLRDFSNKIDEYRHKSNQDKLDFLSKFWEFPIQKLPFKLIGTYVKSQKPDKNGKEYGFFYNVRSINGDILYYPFNLGQVRIWVEHRESLLNQEFWQFDVELNKKNGKNPFQLNLSNRTLGNPKNKFLDRIEKEKLIRKIFDETGYTQRDAKNTSNALKKIAGDLYTETERFIFELLQNADDIPNEKGEVDVRFILLSENLLFLHNGKPFDSQDVESISSIGDSTKRKDAEKTGYKGIGFKSVFTDADTVLINSGNYSFSFDKHSALYNGQNIEEIPWEIKPIWTELYRYPKEVRSTEDFFNFSVAINLEVGDKKISLYHQQIKQLFKEPRFILFLRHVKSIIVEGLSENIKIQKCKKNERFELLWNEVPVDEWLIEDFDFEVSQEVRDSMLNDKIVPSKLKEIEKSKLSFACQIKDNEILTILPEKSFLFTYLPTDVNDYKFPFLINADFLTTANRQSIHVKNNWNLYLFEQVGFLCFKWISSISKIAGLRNSITNLIPKYFENEDEPIQNHFNKGFNAAIDEIAFLPTYESELSKVSDAVVDLTGYSDILGDKLFIDTSFTDKNLVLNELIQKETLTKLKGISIFGTEELKAVFGESNFWEIASPETMLKIIERNRRLGIDSCDLLDIIENADLESINNWIENINIESYKLLLQELENNSLRNKTKESICQIKLFKFSDNHFYSINDLIRKVRDCPAHYYGSWVKYKYVYIKGYFFRTPKIEDIINELLKLGIIISEINTSDYPNIFSSAEKMPDEKQMYNIITERCKTINLTAKEKKRLFLNLTRFEGVGDKILKKTPFFYDRQRKIKSLSELVCSSLTTPFWLNPFKIKAEEYFDELNQYLIQESELFGEIVLPNIEIIKNELSEAKEIIELIKFFKDNQRAFFKEFIIKKNGNSFLIDEKTREKHQVQSADKEAREFIEHHCSENLFVLPYDFLDYKDEDGIVKNLDLYINVIDYVTVDKLQEELISIISPNYVSYQAKLKFLNNLSKIQLLAENNYVEEDFECKVLEMACNVVNNAQDLSAFRQKVVIKSNEGEFLLTDIPPVTDKVLIPNTNKEFSLSKILPFTYQNSNLISDLILSFTKLGISNKKLNALFGVNEELDIENIFEKFSEQTEIIEKPDQFFFLIYYHLHIRNVDISKLGFDFKYAVSSSEFALEKEKLPEYVLNWIKNSEIKLSEIEKIGVWTEATVIVELRKYFSGTIQEFQNNRIAQETRFNNDETSLFNTLEWLKEKEIKLSTEEQFSTFKKVVEVINDNRTKGGELIIQNEYDFELLGNEANEWDTPYYDKWKEELDYQFYIFLFEGAMPKNVKLNEIDDYIFYRYNQGDIVFDDEKIIYINRNADIKKALSSLISDDNNEFSTEDLLLLYQSKETVQTNNDEVAELKTEVERLRKVIESLTQVSGTDTVNVTTKTDEYLTEIKEKSEKYLYNILKNLYPNKTVKWLNYDDKTKTFEESWEHHDFEILNINRNVLHYIDCKGTPLQKKTFYLTSNEWFFFLDCVQNGKSYQIYRIFNVESNTNYVHIDNLWEWIEKGKIVPYLTATETIKGGRVFLTIND